MKKLLTLVAVLFASATMAHAQFGIIGGLNFSGTDYTANDLINEAKNVTLYHAGVAFKADLPLGFAIQPELTYNVKGAKLDNVGSVDDFQYKNGYIELGAGVQWGIDLLVARPFLVAEPFIGYMVNPDSEFKTINEEINKLEYGIGIGAGVDLLNHLQLSVQWYKNLGQLVNGSASSTADVWDSIKDVKSYHGIRVTLGIFF